MEESVDLHEEAGKENKQTFANLNPAEEATSKDEVEIEKSLQKQKSKILFGHLINILLTELRRFVRENLDLGRWYRPHCVRSVLATSVKIFPYRPPARLLRTNYMGITSLYTVIPSSGCLLASTKISLLQTRLF